MVGAPLRWIEDPAALRKRAAALVIGFAGLRNNERTAAITEAFREEQVFRVVFESNHIEGAGATTLTETRKIAARALSPRPLEPTEHARRRFIVHRIWASRTQSRSEAMRQLTALPEGIPIERHLPIVTFEGRTRLGREVIQHAGETQHTLGRAERFGIKRMMLWAQQQRARARHDGRPLVAWPADWPPEDALAIPRLVDQRFVRAIHERIARDLLDPSETEGIPPGQYRIDRRGAGPLGHTRWFLSPEQIEPAMRVWVRRSNQLALSSGVDPLYRACWIMHRFTEIHPFPDFNGRLARLLMNLSLYADGLPFPVSFPVGAKWRRRYADALRAGDRGDIAPLMTLIARAIVDAFERLDAQLRAAGLPGIPQGRVGLYAPPTEPKHWGWDRVRDQRRARRPSVSTLC